jgi:hypothetical protein
MLCLVIAVLVAGCSPRHWTNPHYVTWGEVTEIGQSGELYRVRCTKKGLFISDESIVSGPKGLKIGAKVYYSWIDNVVVDRPSEFDQFKEER